MIHPQLQQLLNLVLLLLLGKYVAHIYLPFWHIVLILLSTMVIEHIMLYMKNKEITFFSFSSLSTAIGVMLMMVSPSLWVIIVVIIFGLFQKHFLTCHKQHFFNPSNFALIMGLLFFYKDAHIVLGQLGNNIVFASAVMVLGAVMLYRVERWIIPASFVLFYLGLQYICIVNTDPVLIMEEVFYRFYSVSFIVFVLFMLTDPKTTPSKVWQQIVFALFLALCATLLDYLYAFRIQHLFMALFILSPFAVLLRLKEKHSDMALLKIAIILLFLVLSAIIYIEMQPPYYFEMDK